MNADNLHPSWLDQLDRAWDRQSRGEPAPSAALDRSLLTTIERLHALDRDTPAPVRTDQIWQRVTTAGTATRPATAPQLLPARRPKPHRLIWNRLADGAAAALLTVAILGSLAVLHMNHAPAIVPAVSPSFRLLISDEAGDRLLPLNPITLNEEARGQEITAATPAIPSGVAASSPSPWIASADGSTLVNIDWPTSDRNKTAIEDAQNVTLTVIDARSGRRLSHFHPVSWNGWMPLISADGRWIVVAISGSILLPKTGDVSGNTSPRWYVYDTRDGQLISIIQSLDPAPWSEPVLALIDPSGNRFYHLVIDRHASYPGPWPTQLVVNDMRTGTELDRLPLPNVVAGQNTDRPTDCAKMPQPNGTSLYFPGAAISPDGQTLALVAPDAQSVTLVNLTHLSVRREISLTPPSTPAASPGTECYLNERNAVAFFAPDSNHLIVNQVDQAGSGANQTMTIRPPFRVNLTTGRIDSTGPTDAKYFLLPQSTVVSPDGRAVYGFTFPNSSDGAIPDQKPRVTLVRLDTTTLHIEARREFTGFRSIVILPGG